MWLDYDALATQLRLVKRTAWATRKLASLLRLERAEEIDVDRALAFLDALTPEERANPERIGPDTLARVSRDTGIGVAELSMLHEHFRERFGVTP